MVDNRVDGKDNHEYETMEFHDDIMITPVRIIGLLLLLAGDPLLLFQLDDGAFSSLYNFMMSWALVLSAPLSLKNL